MNKEFNQGGLFQVCHRDGTPWTYFQLCQYVLNVTDLVAYDYDDFNDFNYEFYITANGRIGITNGYALEWTCDCCNRPKLKFVDEDGRVIVTDNDDFVLKMNIEDYNQ